MDDAKDPYLLGRLKLYARFVKGLGLLNLNIISPNIVLVIERRLLIEITLLLEVSHICTNILEGLFT